MRQFTSSTKTKRITFTLTLWAAALAATASLCSAQTGRVPVPIRQRSVPYSPSATDGAQTMRNFALAAANGGVAGFNSLDGKDLGAIPQGTVALVPAEVDVSAQNPIVGFSFVDDKGKDLSSVFQAEKALASKKSADDPSDPCTDSNKVTGGKCEVLIGFSPSDDHTSVTATVTVHFLVDPKTLVKITLKATGAAAQGCLAPKRVFLPLKEDDKLYPLLPVPVTPATARKVYNDFGDPVRKTVVNCFYNTNTPFTYFNQYQSIYNAASGANTVKLQIGSLNFGNGMQLTLATSPQITPTSSSSSSATSGTLTGGVATLSSSSSAQAAQNILNGGTFFGENLYPLVSRQGNLMLTLYGALREGIDVQKFNNTSVTLSNPSSHTFVGFDGYFQYNAVNNAANSNDSAGSIFVGAMYGYNLMNHTYSVQNGFGGKINTQLGQVTAGVLLNGTVKVAASYGFGPSQRYIDSTTMATTTVNNFNKWSVAIAYQSSGSGKSK